MKTISEQEMDQSDHDPDPSVERPQEERIYEKRNRVVARVRYIVFFVLLAVTIAVSFSVYHYTKNEELDAFENHFAEQAGKVIQAFKFNAVRRLEALEAFSLQITSHAISSNSTFPFVTLPDFERHATYTLQLAEVVALLTFPIITQETRADWEAYSRANQGWLVEGLSIQHSAGNDEDAVARLQGEFDKGEIVDEDAIDEANYQISPVIYKVKPGTTEAEYEDGPGPYTPVSTLCRHEKPGVIDQSSKLTILDYDKDLANGTGNSNLSSCQLQHFFASFPCKGAGHLSSE